MVAPTTEKQSLSKPVEQELSQLRRQHQLILNAVGEGVYGLDLEGNVTFANPAAAQMIDWSLEELIGKSMHAVLHHSHADGRPYPRENCPIYAALKDGVAHRVMTEVFWRKDGSNFPVEYISTPMRDEKGTLIGAVVTFRDISQRRWAEKVLEQTNEDLELKIQERTQKLRQANQQLKELNEMRSRFIAMVCHEFRNPLNNITLSISSLKRYSDHLSPGEKADYLSNINGNVERMTQIIDDILVLGRIEAKVLAVNLETLDIVAFCRALLTEGEFIRAVNPIQFICPSRQILVDIDERLLRSILGNLLINAIHYTDATKAIALKLRKWKNTLIIKVEDQGIGITRKDKKYLFEPFHRGCNVSNIPGTGLGLSIVKQSVDLLGGSIHLTSQVNHGTTFTVRLPIHPESI
ncbi:PAS domain-containing sensor histidine kinase [Synechococcus moorigangaii CMS01]|nr:PAS domain-containing sensor histidine kinase [Synechococcus moorigangaii CMS01]